MAGFVSHASGSLAGDIVRSPALSTSLRTTSRFAAKCWMHAHWRNSALRTLLPVSPFVSSKPPLRSRCLVTASSKSRAWLLPAYRVGTWRLS